MAEQGINIQNKVIHERTIQTIRFFQYKLT